jgi:hypothetical protein
MMRARDVPLALSLITSPSRVSVSQRTIERPFSSALGPASFLISFISSLIVNTRVNAGDGGAFSWGFLFQLCSFVGLLSLRKAPYTHPISYENVDLTSLGRQRWLDP